MASQVEPLPIGTFKRIWEEVQENQRTLDGCAVPHDFIEQLRNEKFLGKHFRCTKCGGTVQGQQAHWYRKGLDHGRR